jgi:hypothetical protein
MKHAIISLLLFGGFTALSTMEASAVECAAGVVRAGCVAGGAASSRILPRSFNILSSLRGGRSLSVDCTKQQIY